MPICLTLRRLLASQREIVSGLVPGLPRQSLDVLLSLPSFAREGADTKSHAVREAEELLQLSLRQLIRAARPLVQFPSELYRTLSRMLLISFLPPSIQSIVVRALRRAQDTIHPSTAGKPLSPTVQTETPKFEISETHLRISDISYPIQLQPRNPELIPDTLFYDIPSHLVALRDLLRDWSVGERHLLLIGNQGVGKNKLTDRLLQVLQLEREYMQLHRDTTVHSLTQSPVLEGGRIVYQDSPLVNAVRHGRILVIDEADKAPLEVVAVLKGLIEDGEMRLVDGRILREVDPGLPIQEGVIPIHPEFKAIVLANRPGFPFLGNDFFQLSGDIFSCMLIENPDASSEEVLLRSYGPDVPRDLIQNLIAAFQSLRRMVEEGTFSYPYSTRELVAIVKHLQMFPEDGLLSAINNVLSFDVFDGELRRNLQLVFQQHGIPLGESLGGGGQTLRTPTVSLAETVQLGPRKSIGSFRESGAPIRVTGLHIREPGRTWALGAAPERSLEEDGFVQSRLHTFSELKSSLRLPLDLRRERVVDAVILPDESVHVLVTDPPQIYSWSDPETAYQKYHLRDLEDFSPPVPLRSGRLLAFPGMNRLGVVYPQHYILVLLEPPRSSASTLPDQVESAEGTGTGAISVLPLPVPGGDEDSALSRFRQSFLNFLSPGFRSPHSRHYFLHSGTGLGVDAHMQILPTVQGRELLLYWRRGQRSLSVVSPGKFVSDLDRRLHELQSGVSKASEDSVPRLDVLEIPLPFLLSDAVSLLASRMSETVTPSAGFLCTSFSGR